MWYEEKAKFKKSEAEKNKAETSDVPKHILIRYYIQCEKLGAEFIKCAGR